MSLALALNPAMFSQFPSDAVEFQSITEIDLTKQI
jgi:hypothetical protein